MAHQNPQALRAVEQNSVAGSGAPDDQAHDRRRAVRPEPRSYATTEAQGAEGAKVRAGNQQVLRAGAAD